MVFLFFILSHTQRLANNVLYIIDVCNIKPDVPRLKILYRDIYQLRDFMF